MVVNESAYYHGKLWCVYELKDSHGNYREELRLKMRKESQKNIFRCPDCGKPLILCAGHIMEPFFKHYDRTNCILSTEDGRRKNLTARRMLYHLAKDSFPDAQIMVNQKFRVVPLEQEIGVDDHFDLSQKDKKLEKTAENEWKAKVYTADIYLELTDRKIVLEYLSYEGKLAAWEEKHNYYASQGILDIWFLNARRYQNEISTTFEYLLGKHSKVILLLDSESGELVLKEKCTLAANGGVRLISKSYPIAEVRLGTDGAILCDYEEYKEQVVKEANESIRKEQEEQRRKEQLEYWDHQDGQLALFDFEPSKEKNGNGKNRSEKYRNEKNIGKNNIGKNNTKENDRREKIGNEKGNEIERREKPSTLQTNVGGDEKLSESGCKSAILRTPFGSREVTKNTMKILSIQELWELPELTGMKWQIQRANQKRYLYLKKLDRELLSLDQIDDKEKKNQKERMNERDRMDEEKERMVKKERMNEKERMIEKAVEWIENLTDAALWL